MALELTPKRWPGAIRTLTLGAGSRRPVTVGGGKGLPLHTFEAEFPNRPRLALEVTDVAPPSWAEAVRKPWEGVLGHPAAAARRAVDDFGADLVMLHLAGTHPDRGDRSADQAVADVRAVLEAVPCPLIVKGSGSGAKQNAVLSRVAEAASGEGLVLHSACQEDYKTLAAVAVAYGHTLVAESPIDINIAKQLSILLSESSVDLSRVLIDPLTGGLGYGLEYTYSVMERIRLAALGGEAMLSCPVICLVGEEAWKAKEAKTAEEKEPSWGDAAARGVHWEIATALTLLLSGADVVVLRHPEALARVRRQIDVWFEGESVAMALTGLQIFKLLPNTNCKKCGQPTCLAFAMKLAAGKEALDKCPDASAEARAALGAASAPPLARVTIGSGPRAIAVGEETVFFRHEKTFVRRPALIRDLDLRGLGSGEIAARLDEWAQVRHERAGEVFQVDGVTLSETEGVTPCVEAVAAARERGLPVVLLAATPAGAATILEPIKDHRPLLVPPRGADQTPFVALAARLAVPIVVSAVDLPALAGAAVEASKAGVKELLLEAPGENLRELHRSLSLIRRGALDRLHPGLGHPTFLRVGKGEVEKAVLGITKFASVIALADTDAATWLPLWTLRQNIYTDPQKPLQMTPGIYPLGEPDARSPLLVTTNFSLTYFIVSTELDGVGLASHLAVVDTEGMSVLTAWSAGKLSGERVAKALKEMTATERVSHKTVIIPGYAAVISGELEDALGAGWRVLTGPQEASDLGPFLRDVWTTAGA